MCWATCLPRVKLAASCLTRRAVHRLDSQGNRFGKVVAYRMSEVRVGELLDTLCTTVSSRNQLAIKKTGDAAEWEWTEDVTGSEWTPLSQAEGRQHSKELENFCVRLVSDEYEEDLTEALRSEEGVDRDDLHRILCLQSKACAAERGRTEL